MGDIYSPRAICTAARLYFVSDCCLSVLHWYDAIPPEDTFFATMPMGIIDFELGGAASFEDEGWSGGEKCTLPPLRFEIYYEVTAADTDGSIANAMIWRLWWCLVNRLRGNKYWGTTVAGSRLTGGTVEGFPIESEEIGIRCRFAWATCEVWRTL
jgi:hypothetical protein